MPRKNSDNLKNKFSNKSRPTGDDFGDLIDSCINNGYTGNIIVGNSTFTIKNGIIEDITANSEDDNIQAAPRPETPAPVKDTGTAPTRNAITLKSGTVYDGTYIHEDKIFPDSAVLKVYVNLTTRNRFIAYKAKNGKIYWEIVKRGWFGTMESVNTTPGLKTGIKSKSYDVFIDLKDLRGDWQKFFKESSVKANIKHAWNIS